MSSVPDGLSNLGRLTLYVFAPSQLGVFAKPRPGGGFFPVGPDEALATSGAAAVLDGPMFDRCDESQLSGSDAARYAQSQCGLPQFLMYDTARGVSTSGRRPGDGLTISVVGNSASAASGAQAAGGSQVAVQLYPPLVRGGRDVTNPGIDAESVGRAGLAILDDGRLALGQFTGSMTGLAQAFLQAGAVEAGYTDGGGSTALAVPGRIYGSSERRRVPTWIMVTGGSSGPGLGGLLIAGGVAAMLWAAWQASRPHRRT